MTTKPQPVFSVQSESTGFTVYRDDAALQTPKNLSVTVPTQVLADAIVQECCAQKDRLDLRTMPLTQMTLTALDITTSHRDEVITSIVRYGESELLCQRTAEPADLAAEQQRVWQPYLDWCKATYAADMHTGTGIAPFPQNAAALVALRTAVQAFDVFALTGLSEAVGVSGSLVLGLALAAGYADPATVLAAAELDQLWQNKKWGEDPAVQARHVDILRDLALCVQWLALLK